MDVTRMHSVPAGRWRGLGELEQTKIRPAARCQRDRDGMVGREAELHCRCYRQIGTSVFLPQLQNRETSDNRLPEFCTMSEQTMYGSDYDP